MHLRALRSTGLMLLLAASLPAASCATQQVKWGEETETTATTTAAPATAAPAHLDAAGYAQRFPTDGACESEARRIATATPSLATQLIVACIERGDFKRLAGLTAAPWTSTLSKSPQAVRLCARVVAARAGDVEADVQACAKAGFPVKTLHDAFSSPSSAKGKTVIFRARPDLENEGARKVTRLIETTYAAGDVDTEPTGRRVAAASGIRTLAKTDVIYIGRVLRVGVDPIASDGDALVTVDVVEMWAPALTATLGS